MATNNTNEVEVVLDYTTRDFDSILSMLIDIAKSKFPEWVTVEQPGDFGRLLLELYAYMGDVSNYYIDRVGAEAFLGTAQRRQSVYYMADMLGYKPISQLAATVNLTFTALDIEGLTNSITVPKGTVVATNSESEADVVYFETDYDLVLERGKSGTVSATEGLTVIKETIGFSEGGNRSYALANKGIIFQTVKLYTVEGSVIIPWAEVDAIVNARPNQSAYSTYIDDTDTTYLLLGDNSSGRIPAIGSEMYVSYRYGQGSVGNSVGIGTLTDILNPSDWASVVTVTNTESPNGGADYEKTETMRYAIPRASRTRNRAVTLDDHATLALQVPGVGKAIAYGSVYSSVTVRIAGSSGFIVSEATESKLINSVSTYLNDKVLIGARVFVETAEWHDVQLTLTVNVLDGYVRETVESSVRDAIYNVFAFDRLDFGTKVSKGDVYRAATGVKGVDYVEINKMRPVEPSEYEVATEMVQNIVPPERRIAQLQRSRVHTSTTDTTTVDTYGQIIGLTLNMVGGLETT